MGLTTGRRPVPDSTCPYFPDRFVGHSELCKCYPCWMTSTTIVNTGSSFEYVKMTGPLKPSPILISPVRLAKIPLEVELTCKEQFCKLKFMGVPGTEFC